MLVTESQEGSQENEHAKTFSGLSPYPVDIFKQKMARHLLPGLIGTPWNFSPFHFSIAQKIIHSVPPSLPSF